MVHLENSGWTRRCTPLLVLLAGGLLWMIAGCIEESPLAISPDGKTLAFVTVEPYRTQDGHFLIGPQSFRLMLLNAQRQIRVLDESTTTMLTAPAFSPDGIRLAYLRVPLPTWQQSVQQEKDFEQRSEALKKLANPTWLTLATEQQAPATQSQPAAVQIRDLALPPLKNTYISAAVMMLAPSTTATLIVRDVETNRILSDIPVELSLLGPEPMYVNTRPEFDPAGRQVYFASGDLVMAVDLKTGDKRILSANTSASRLSPDGRMLATFVDDSLGLATVDGNLTIYRRLPASPAGSPAWIDPQTVAVLQAKARAAPAATHPTAMQPASITTEPAATQQDSPSSHAFFVIQRVRQNGTLLDPVEVPAPREAAADSADMLAVAPDGRHIVIAVSSGALFASLDGTTFRYYKNSDLPLQHPTFSPDSRYVAFKSLQNTADKSHRTAAIVFFSPEGKELHQVPVPAIAPGSTRPASQPATQPSR